MAVFCKNPDFASKHPNPQTRSASGFAGLGSPIMKKLLALVLALVMTLGLATVGTSAAYSDFTDTADVSFEEAMKVMNAVGVFVGDGNKLDPKGNLTRAQAAKLVAYLALGEDIAEALPKTGSKFTDAPDGAWFTGYVNYMANEGYTTGTSATTFSPNGSLTGYQFGAFLLAVLGYDREIEGMVGNDWETKVAVKLEECGITDGVDKLGSVALTREEAAQFCLNSLKATMVEYADKGTVVAIGGATVTTGAKKATPVAVSGATLNYNGAIDTASTVDEYDTMQLAEKLYKGKLLLAEDTTDTFGRPADIWSYKNTDVATTADEAVATFTAKTSAADVAKALSGYKIKNTVTSGSAVGNYNINNTTTYSTLNKLTIDNGNTNNTAGEKDQLYVRNNETQNAREQLVVENETIAKALADLTANGRLVEVYASSSTKVVTKIVEVNYFVQKVTSVTTNSAGNVSYTFSLGDYGTDYADTSTTDTVKVHGTVAKDDYVTTVKPVGSVTLQVYPTTTFTGIQSSRVMGAGNVVSSAVIGGETKKIANGVRSLAGNWYTAATLVGDDDDANAYSKFTTNTSKEHTYYVDQYGFMVAHEEIDAEIDYAVVDSLAGYLSDTGVDTTQSVKAVLVFADGSKQTVDVEVIKLAGVSYYTDVKLNEGTASKKGVDVQAAAARFSDASDEIQISKKAVDNAGVGYSGRIVAYSVSSGKYTLSYTAAMAAGTAGTAKVAVAGAANAIDKGVPRITNGVNTISGNAKTVYVIKSLDANNNKVFNAYTGYENVPTVKAGAAQNIDVFFMKNASNEVVFVYADASGSVLNEVGDSTTSNIFYATGTSIDKIGTGDTAYYSLAGILNGANDTIKSKKSDFNTIAASKKFYKLTVDGEGYVTAATNAFNWSDTGTTSGTAVTIDMANEKTESTFNGRLIGSDTKIYVIETDGTARTGSYTDFVAGDVYYANVDTTASTEAGKNTFTKVFIVKQDTFYADASTDAINAAFDAGNGSVTVDLTGAFTTNAVTALDVPTGSTLTFNANGYIVTLNNTSDNIDGNIIVNNGSLVVTDTDGTIGGNITITEKSDNSMGDLSFGEATTVNGDISVEGSMTVSTANTFAGAISVGETLILDTAASTFNGNVTAYDLTTDSVASDFNGDVYVTHDLAIDDTTAPLFDAGHKVVVGNDMSLTVNTTFSTLTVTGNVDNSNGAAVVTLTNGKTVTVGSFSEYGTKIAGGNAATEIVVVNDWALSGGDKILPDIAAKFTFKGDVTYTAGSELVFGGTQNVVVFEKAVDKDLFDATNYAIGMAGSKATFKGGITGVTSGADMTSASGWFSAAASDTSSTLASADISTSTAYAITKQTSNSQWGWIPA